MQDGRTVSEALPKSDRGARTVVLDVETAAVLGPCKATQAKPWLKWGSAWTASGRVFTTANGEALYPGTVAAALRCLVVDAGLPPVRFHDLRHGAATLIHAAGGDIFAIKETLGHPSIGISMDTCTSLLPEVDMTIAEAASRIVPALRSQGFGGPRSRSAPAGERRRTRGTPKALALGR